MTFPALLAHRHSFVEIFRDRFAYIWLSFVDTAIAWSRRTVVTIKTGNFNCMSCDTVLFEPHVDIYTSQFSHNEVIKMKVRLLAENGFVQKIRIFLLFHSPFNEFSSVIGWELNPAWVSSTFKAWEWKSFMRLLCSKLLELSNIRPLCRTDVLELSLTASRFCVKRLAEEWPECLRLLIDLLSLNYLISFSAVDKVKSLLRP